MPTIEREGISVHWEVQGRGEPLLLIMGHMFSSKMWAPVLPDLMTRFQTITLDNRGSGKSTHRPGVTSISTMAQDALAVLDAVEVDRAHVYGLSMGGMIAMDMALRNERRVHSLVLGCTAIVRPERPVVTTKLAFAQYWLPRPLSWAMAKRVLYGPAASADAVAADVERLRHEARNPSGHLAQGRGLASHVLSLDDAARITAPTLVLHGTADKVAPIAWGQEVAATLPNASFIPLEGAGHNFLVAAPGESNAAVLAFLANHPIT